jgi:hypothetical protein
MFTPEGTVGLGGPLLVSESLHLVQGAHFAARLTTSPLIETVYPMESPGGYQFWGRSLSAWDVSHSWRFPYKSDPDFLPCQGVCEQAGLH